MIDTGNLTPDRILDAAEEVLGRFGLSKANVVDVARALGVSHGSLYRHFPSKAALRDAVTERWLGRLSDQLVRIVNEPGPAPQRLRRWFARLIEIKRQKALAEPELFATYHAIFAEARDVIRRHIDILAGQVSQIIADGVARGEFAEVDPASTGKAIFFATARFHDPSYASEWNDPGLDAVFEDIWALIARGLSATPARTSPGGKKPSRRRS